MIPPVSAFFRRLRRKGDAAIASGRLMRFPQAVRHDPSIDEWFRRRPRDLGAIASRCFAAIQRCGGDVQVLMHDDQPTACVGDAAFAYVASYTAHVNIGFFMGAELPDRDGLLEGTGKYMRHVKLAPNIAVDEKALTRLIVAAYEDMKRRVVEDPGDVGA